MSSIKERLAAAKLPERSVQVCLRGDLAAEFDELEAQLQKAANEAAATSRRMAAKSETAQIVEKQNALREQMAAEMLTLRLRALPNAEWRALVRENPPRKGNEGDDAMGLNVEGLMSVAIPRSVIEPELDEDDWETLNNVLSSGDYDKILTAVWMLNRGGVEVPKLSRIASLVSAQNGEGSKRLPGSE